VATSTNPAFATSDGLSNLTATQSNPRGDDLTESASSDWCHDRLRNRYFPSRGGTSAGPAPTRSLHRSVDPGSERYRTRPPGYPEFEPVGLAFLVKGESAKFGPLPEVAALVPEDKALERLATGHRFALVEQGTVGFSSPMRADLLWKGLTVGESEVHCLVPEDWVDPRHLQKKNRLEVRSGLEFLSVWREIQRSLPGEGRDACRPQGEEANQCVERWGGERHQRTLPPYGVLGHGTGQRIHQSRRGASSVVE